MAKNLRKVQHVGEHGPNHLERWAGKARRPARKAEERKRKMAAKMKHAGYPAKFTSAKEQETRENDYSQNDD